MDIQVVLNEGRVTIDPVATEKLLERAPYIYHSEFHRICQSVYAQQKEHSPSETNLDTLGFDVIKTFTSSEIAQALSESFSELNPERTDSANSVILPTETLKNQITSVIEQAMQNGVADLIEQHLGCFFRIDHVQCMRTKKHPETQGVSFRWHRDFEPIAQLHIMLYLTECCDESPATLFTTLEDTRRLANSGYSFPIFEDRVENINTWLPAGEKSASLHRPLLNSGDATIFGASRILHCGSVPTSKIRDIVLLNILPSLHPWHQEIEYISEETLYLPRGTMFINPFELGHPKFRHEDEDQLRRIPNWFVLSHFFPQ